MSYKVKQIELIFENLESVIIDGRHIKDIGMCGVTDLVCMKHNEVHFDENISCIFFVISEDGNLKYAPIYDRGESSTVFERIMKCRDITCVCLSLEDTVSGARTERSYNVPWDGTCDENLRQRTVYEGGNLAVHIE